jgi:hypothetical protein
MVVVLAMGSSTLLAEPSWPEVHDKTFRVQNIIFPSLLESNRPEDVEWTATVLVSPFGPKGEYSFRVSQWADRVEAQIVAIDFELKDAVRNLMIEFPGISDSDLAARLPRIDKTTTSAECAALVPIDLELIRWVDRVSALLTGECGLHIDADGDSPRDGDGADEGMLRSDEPLAGPDGGP